MKIVLAAGGTGGHIFPAEAVAKKLSKEGHSVILITDYRSKKYIKDFAADEIKYIRSGGTGGRFYNKIFAAINILIGVFQASSILKKIKPDVVVGFGGYPSFPTMQAATSIKVKTLIHEQNAVLGKVNSFLAPKVNVILTSFEKTEKIKEKDTAKVVFTGNPVRSQIFSVNNLPYPKLESNGSLHILVTGGSQGARLFSKIIPEAIVLLKDEVRASLRIDQQCRADDIESVRQIYKDAKVNAELATFFDDMPSRLAASHLVIARAGASTTSELLIAARPAILVPFKHARDDHQTLNAKALEEKNACIVIAEDNFTPETLAAKIEELFNNPRQLQDMSDSARSAARLDAVERLVNEL